jgi:hypothetical protein
MAVAGGLAWHGLYDPRVHGLPTHGAIDSVGHLMELQAVSGPQPRRYDGMVAFQVTAYWLGELGLDAFRAFRAVTYGVLIGLLGLVAIVHGLLAAELDGPHRPALGPWWLVGLSLALGAYPFIHDLLPLLHGYLLEGYFPQLAGLLPLYATALLYAVSRRRLGRMLVLMLGVGLLRFTYLLTIVDLVATSALLIAWEALLWESDTARRRRVAALAAVGMVLAGYFYAELYRIADNGGAIPAPELELRILGTGVGSLVLLAIPYLLRRVRIGRPAAPVERLAAFVGLYGLVTTVVQLAWMAKVYARDYTQDDVYLLHKYGFAASVLVTVTLVPYVAHLLVSAAGALRAFRHRRLVPEVALAAAAAVLGAVASARSLPPGYAELLERQWRGQRTHLTALGDPEAWVRIRRVLAGDARRFVAFLAPLTTETLFAGYSLRAVDPAEPMPPLDPHTGLPRELDYFAVADLGPGRCVFWLAPELFAHIDAASGRDFERRHVVEQLDRGPKRCEPYPRASHPAGLVELCHRCAP